MSNEKEIFGTPEWHRKRDALNAVKSLIAYIGDDPKRAGLAETPERFLKAWRQSWGAGYQEGAQALVKLFKDDDIPAPSSGVISSFGGRHIMQDAHQQHGQMVLVDNIIFHSHCEHHIAPFFGVAHVAYIPGSKGIVGISKLARIVDHFARRLQVQERLTAQIAGFIEEHISPDVGIVLKARHMCMVSRGVKQQHAQTITSALKGSFFSNASCRAEFLALARSSNYSCD